MPTPVKSNSRVLPVFRGLITSGLVLLLITFFVIQNQLTSAQDQSLVINEIDFAQSSDGGDFLELKNLTSETISYDELRVDVALLAGEGGPLGINELRIPDLSVPPNAHYVICGDTTQVPNCDYELTIDNLGFYEDLTLPEFLPPDSQTTFIEAVGLRISGRLSTTTEVLDEIGIGGPNIRQNGAFGLSFITAETLPDTGDGLGVSRVPDGRDSDTNLLDFQVCPITPGEPNGGSCQRAEIHLNAGQQGYSGFYFDPLINNIWSRDSYFNGGQAIDRSIEFEDQEIDNLYLYERCCLEGYDFPVPNGLYLVNLHFMELAAEAQAAGFRQFGVEVESATIPMIDIIAEAGGRERPLKHSLYVLVADEMLSISFNEIIQEPIINGIEIIPVDTVPNLTLTPSATPTQTPFLPPTSTPTATVPITITATPILTTTVTPSPTPTEDPSPPQGDLPDLVLQFASISAESFSSCLLQEEPFSLGLRLTILNQGEGASGPFTVEITGGDRLSVASGLAVNETATLFFGDYDYGSQPVTVMIDVDGEVAESDEDNNQSTELLPVPTPPPFCTPTPTATPSLTPTPEPPALTLNHYFPYYLLPPEPETAKNTASRGAP